MHYLQTTKGIAVFNTQVLPNNSNKNKMLVTFWKSSAVRNLCWKQAATLKYQC